MAERFSQEFALSGIMFGNEDPIYEQRLINDEPHAQSRCNIDLRRRLGPGALIEEGKGRRSRYSERL